MSGPDDVPGDQDTAEPDFSDERVAEMRELDDRADLVPDNDGGDDE